MADCYTELEKSGVYIPPEYEDREIVINGMPWRKLKGIYYGDRNNYYKIYDEIEKYKGEEKLQVAMQMYRIACISDLWFILYFVMRIPTANHPFVVKACKDVQFGPPNRTIDLWAREHFKSSIITIAESIHKILRDPEKRIGIFSYSRPAAISFLRAIKFTLESSALLKGCFPDVLYVNPHTEAFKWSESDGIYVRRKSGAKEATVEAYGLLEGMPVGKHYTDRVYDDVETPDMTYTPEITQKLKDMFDMSQNLGTLDGVHRVVGTPYSHEGLLMYLADKKDASNESLYTLRKKPATDDGTPNGQPLLLPESRMVELRTNKSQFYSQQLVDPTPQGTQQMRYEHIKGVWAGDVPPDLYKFMTVDPAGQRKDRVGDSWAILVCGVEPCMNDNGASDLYILDIVCEPLTEVEAIDTVVKMYSRNGRILKIGVEKTGQTTTEIHVANALRAKGKIVSIENGTLEILRPAGRSKESRIVENLNWPLDNGKIHILNSIPNAYKERLRIEMQRFPFWHDDLIDALSYQYDLIKSYRFGKRNPGFTERKKDAWDIAMEADPRPKYSWMYT